MACIVVKMVRRKKTVCESFMMKLLSIEVDSRYSISRCIEILQKSLDLENKLGEFGGMKWLYAHTYYSDGDFWKQFDRSWHEKLRTKYRAITLPDVHEKVHVDIEKLEAMAKQDWGLKLRSIWPLGGFFGIYKSIKSGDWRIPKNSTWSWRQ